MIILTRKARILITIGAIVAVLAIGTPILTVSLLRMNTINVTLLENAGVMIENRGIRIYIDPITLPTDYRDLPADIICITHPHGDHLQGVSISLVKTNDTVIIHPDNISDMMYSNLGIGVDPLDQVEVGDIKITAFYMYTLPVDIYPASHPKENNWTSYIIDINGFTIFHAGDSKNIEEYEDLTGTIDLALLPLGPGCQTMYREEVCDALEVIQPKYFIPIHYAGDELATFTSLYEDSLDCQMIALEYFTSHKFRS